MHPYISYLLSDIKAAHMVELLADRNPMSFEEEMAGIACWVSGEGGCQLSDFTKLKREHFPPSSQLNDIVMLAVIDTFGKMLESWNSSIVFSDKMPVDKRY